MAAELLRAEDADSDVLPGAGDARRVRHRRRGAAGARGAGAPGRRALQFHDETMREEPVRVVYMWLKVPGAPGDSTMLVQVAETLQSARLAQQDHQGRDPAAVHHPAAGGGVGVVCAGARHQAAEPAAAASAGAAAPTGPDRRTRRARRGGSAGALINELLGRLDQSIRTQKQFPRRRGAPAEDAAGRAAHAGRAGLAARSTPAPPDAELAEELAEQTSAPANAPRTWSTSCWPWRAP